MKVLVIGDSITQGRIGVNYVTLLEQDFPSVTFTNMGLGGDTLVGISKRLLKVLEKRSFDVIIIEAGHNDLLIPAMKELTPRLQLYAHWFEVRGSTPTLDATTFEAVYRETVIEVLKLSSAPIILTTLSCLGESLDTSVNAQRAAYNGAIRSIAHRYQCILADVGAGFDDFLLGQESSDCFLGQFLDVVRTLTPEGANKLSSDRTLSLTIDGVHINQAGAALYAKLIGDALAPLVG